MPKRRWRSLTSRRSHKWWLEKESRENGRKRGGERRLVLPFQSESGFESFLGREARDFLGEWFISYHFVVFKFHTCVLLLKRVSWCISSHASLNCLMLLHLTYVLYISLF